MLPVIPVHTDHSRSFHDNRFVYPVVSRRSRGVSIGVNLNPDKICNFDCIYCQVDRRSEAETKFVATEQLLNELREMFRLFETGELWQDARFAATPPALRRLNDIAFSGDGEPTTFRNFDLIVNEVAALKRMAERPDVKLVLITNASMFHRPHVVRALQIFDANNGEIWAKLDAGTDAYYQLIERTKIPFTQILRNITDAAQVRPLVIQSLFMQVHGEPPTWQEIEEWIARLHEVQQAGGTLKQVQVYTVARVPAESFVTPLPDATVDEIAGKARDALGIPVDAFYGKAVTG